MNSPGIVIEETLRSLPLMHIVVDDQDALQIMCMKCMLCCQGHIVKVTIFIKFGFHCMMTRRTNDGQAILGFSH